MKTKHLCLYSLFLLLAVALTGCTKYEDDFISKYCPGSCTVVKGRITTANGTQPIPGVSLTANWDNIYYMGGGTIRKKAVAQTDADGYYTLSFLLRDDELQEGSIVIKNSVDASKYLSCQYTLHLSGSELRRDTTMIKDFYYPESAKLVLQLTNRQDLQPSDALSGSVMFRGGIGEEQMCGYQVSWGNNGPTDQELTVAAESPVLLQTTKTKAGLTTTQTDTLHLGVGERRIYPIVF